MLRRMPAHARPLGSFDACIAVTHTVLHAASRCRTSVVRCLGTGQRLQVSAASAWLRRALLGLKDTIDPPQENMTVPDSFAVAAAELKRQVWGEVLLPADGAAWQSALKTWALPLKPVTPAVVVQPRGVVDIQLALKFAKEQGLEVAVKGGGHSPTMLCLVEGGLVIDMSSMRGVHVDSHLKTASAEGGVLLGDVDRATGVYQLAVPLGHAPVTGIGLALNGGMGVLKQVFGPTAQHIVAATIVLADGSVAHVNEESDPELLWGLQGAGAALGVVAELTFRLHDVSSAYAGVLIIPDDPQHNNLRAILRFMQAARQEPGYTNNVLRALHRPSGKQALHLMLAFLGPKSEEEKAAFIAPLRALGPLHDTIRSSGYMDMQMAFLPLCRGSPPHYEYWTSGQFAAEQVTDEFLDTYCELLDSVPESCQRVTVSMISTWRGPPGVNMGHAVETDAGTGPHGLCRPEADFGWSLQVGFTDAAHFEEGKAYARKVKAQLSRVGDSDVYVNTTTLDHNTEAALAARVGGEAKLARLRALKARVDPDNVFKSHPFKGL